MSKHWLLETDQHNIAWLFFDKHDSSTNTLSADELEELASIIQSLKEQFPRGLVITSAKNKGFIAGANVRLFGDIKDREQALVLVELGHTVFNALEALPFPTLALINGFCVGGGLELALACRYRIALDDPGTRIGLPEVRLGIHPGWGGTVRMIRLLGALAAMDLMLTGRTVSARAAKKIGLVDQALPERHLNNAAIAYINQPPAVHKPSFFENLANLRLLRPVIAGYLDRMAGKKANPDHYPAPFALIGLWKKHGGDEKTMLKEEAESVASLITSPTAQNLVRVFMLQERLKSYGRDCNTEMNHVHVIGAGVMGGDIAAWCALRGLKVTLQDQDAKYIAAALKRAGKLFKKRLKDRTSLQAAMNRLVPDHNGVGISRADIIIEAIVENIEVKQSLFSEIEPKLKQDAILATNTSSIALSRLTGSLENPGRLVGIHFFNPVALMQLVEIVTGEDTDKKTSDMAAAFCRTIDRLPLPVTSTPGFLVNRVLMPYLVEAVILLQEDVPATVIDSVAKSFGMPVGPVELADRVGLDICLSVAEILSGSLNLEVPRLLREKVEQGHLGIKSGEGFYKFNRGKPKHKKVTPGHYETDEISDRLVLQMVNEAMACLHDGVVQDADLVDAGMIFGTGFAPFRGGPMHYLENRGKEDVRQQLIAFQEKYGLRFTPHDGWAT